MRRGNIIILIAILGLVTSGLAQEWEIDLDVYSHPDTVKRITMKTSMYGSDLYDAPVIVGTDTIPIDVGAPPPPPTGFYTYFPLSDTSTPLTQLQVDARSSTQDTIIWTVWWGGTTYPDTVTVDWAGETLPSHGSFEAINVTIGMDPDWGSAVDMSSVTSIKAASWMEWIKIRFVLEDTSDITPPYFTNWVPEDGATDIPTTTSNFSVDIMDDGEVDESTIDINVFGMSIPSMFLTTTAITGGIQAEVDISSLGVDLPACSTITWVVSADDMAENTGTDTASFRTECEDTVFCIDGTVTLEGTTDYEGSIVFAGSYHDTTDAGGAYEICNVPAGTLMVYAYHEGYTTDTMEIVLVSDTTFDFELELLTGSIAGTVTLDGMTDHSGAVVEDWVNDISDTTDSAGTYLLEDVPLGPVELHATYTGYTPAIDSFALNGDTTGIDFYLFTLSDSFDVSGSVSLEGETDYSGTKVLMTGVAYAESVTTDASGDFSFTVEGGTYSFVASHAGFESYENPSLVVDDDLVMDITLDTLETPVLALNPPANLQATNRPCYPEFIYVSWRQPTNGDTLLLSHTGGNMSCGEWDPYVWYSPYGYPGGGYAMPFVAPASGALLTKISLDIATLLPGTQTTFHIWAEDDSGGPGADMITPITVTFSSTVDFETYEVEIDPPLEVGTDPFYVGWFDVAEYPNCIFVRQDYTTPDTLTWIYYALDSAWEWFGDRVNSCDIDFAIEAYVVDTSSSRAPITATPMREALQHTKVSHTRSIDQDYTFIEREPLRGPEFEGYSTPRMRPMEDPEGYRLYRHSTSFTDTTVATLIATTDDTIYGYVDTAITPGTDYYYGIVADYADGSSDLSNLAIGYTNTGPEENQILLIDWAGGKTIEVDLGWEWDPSDSLVNFLVDVGIPLDSITVTGEHDRLYVTDLVDDSDLPLYDLVIIEWNPLSSSGWLGPRPRNAEWHILRNYLVNGGQLFIEGADAMQILSTDGAAAADNQYDSLYSLLGVDYYDQGINSLDTGNVLQLTGNAPLYSPFTEDYSLGHISDFGIDEFEHAMGSGGFTVLTSQLTTPLPHLSNGRGVWNENATYLCNTYVQSPYFASIIDIPVGTTANIVRQLMQAFEVVGIQEKPTDLPDEVTMFGNIPNPFNSSTVIEFKVDEYAPVELTIYDLLGNKVNTIVTGAFKPGTQRVIWDGTDAEGYSVESGIYFYKLTTNTGSVTKRMVLLK